MHIYIDTMFDKIYHRFPVKYSISDEKCSHFLTKNNIKANKFLHEICFTSKL